MDGVFIIMTLSTFTSVVSVSCLDCKRGKWLFEFPPAPTAPDTYSGRLPAMSAGTYSIAPVGQNATHLGSPPHRSHFATV